VKVSVLGAGAWGTAIACHAARRHPVHLWARDPAQAQVMGRRRENPRYLPGVRFPDGLAVGADLDAALAACDGGLLLLGTTMAGLGPVLAEVARHLDAGRPAAMLWLCKGIEPGGERLPHQVVQASGLDIPSGVLSGPSFAQEVAAGLPVALVAAARQPAVRDIAVRALHHDAARIYASEDLVGVEIGGAMKNVIAIAAGICDGLELGLNARAALITRGLAEIARLGEALGASRETFLGLAGVGDLVLTCTGDLSRNRRVGLALATGEPLDAIVANLGHVAEGVPCARAARTLGQRHGVELPITEAVVAVLDGRTDARQAVLALLSREPRAQES
jgi:glycerol-3-phosphate dehydrogenase (NAD(P)+)